MLHVIMSYLLVLPLRHLDQRNQLVSKSLCYQAILAALPVNNNSFPFWDEALDEEPKLGISILNSRTVFLEFLGRSESLNLVFGCHGDNRLMLSSFRIHNSARALNCCHPFRVFIAPFRATIQYVWSLHNQTSLTPWFFSRALPKQNGNEKKDDK